MDNLTFEYPAWFLVVCGLAGLAVALLLYYRDATFREQPRWLIWLMGTLRWLAFSAVAALLLAPLLRYLEVDRQEPVVVLARDISESVLLETDSVAYAADWAALAASLGEKYEVVNVEFGDQRTNLDAVLSDIADVYGNQNLGGIVLASDGIYNEGSNPAYREFQFRAPVYTVGMGDTTVRRDLLIRRVFNNRIAYLDDQFSIQVDVAASNAAGESTRLTVSRGAGGGGSALLHSETIAIDGDDFFTTREIVLDADRAGVQRYRIALTTIGQEVSTANNRRDIFVDVLDARQKVLLLPAAPHPDIAALKQALEGGQNNEVEVVYAKDMPANFDAYDLVVLHQLPAPNRELPPLNVPALFIVGETTPSAALNEAQPLLRISGGNARGNEVTARLNPTFSAFTLSDELRQALPQYPPLQAPFGEFEAGPGSQVVLSQRIGRVDTDFPLLVVGEANDQRLGVLAATGLWQWRLFDFLESGNHARFDELISQLTQYLTVAEDKRRFRVNVSENLVAENEPVTFDAELYNNSYELVNEPEANLTVTGPGGQDYTYVFTRTSNAYTLDAGRLPVGDYRFRGTVDVGGETLVSEGRFSVRPVEVERYVLEADHNLLRQLSDRYGGDLIGPDELAGLPARLEAGGTVKPILFETVNTRNILNFRWLFFLLFGLLVAEWFLRRYFGGY